MLVISRKVDEAVMIGDRIVVMVTEIQKGQVRLGITAPADVRIYREEVLESILRHGKRPAETCPDVDQEEAK